MTDDEIDAALTACNAAAPGPWHVVPGHRTGRPIGIWSDVGRIVRSNGIARAASSEGKHNAAFIALAREALGAALVELLAVRAEKATLELECQRLRARLAGDDL